MNDTENSVENNATKVLRTERLEIVDEQGQCIAALGKGVDQFVGLTFYDKSKEIRMQLRVKENDCPQIILYDSDGDPRIRILINKDDELKIQFCDGAERALLKLALDKNGQSLIELRDIKEATKIAMVVNQEGKGLTVVLDDSQQIIGSLPQKTDLLKSIGTVANVIRMLNSFSS